MAVASKPMNDAIANMMLMPGAPEKNADGVNDRRSMPSAPPWASTATGSPRRLRLFGLLMCQIRPTP